MKEDDQRRRDKDWKRDVEGEMERIAVDCKRVCLISVLVSLKIHARKVVGGFG